MKILFRRYLRFKFANSLFTGLVGGSVFTIYGSLSPSVFSLGGIALALGLMAMALVYRRLMTVGRFRAVSLAAEGVMLALIVYYLALTASPMTGFVVYAGYQLSFMAGGYLVRAETHFARSVRLMGWIDVAKQQGYLAGLALSYLFYRSLESAGITAAAAQVYRLHWLLLGLEILVILLLWTAFGRGRAPASKTGSDLRS